MQKIFQMLHVLQKISLTYVSNVHQKTSNIWKVVNLKNKTKKWINLSLSNRNELNCLVIK